MTALMLFNPGSSGVLLLLMHLAFSVQFPSAPTDAVASIVAAVPPAGR